LITYKHINGGYSHLEKWFRENIANKYEPMFPETWSANTLTILGNAFPVTMGILSLFIGGLSFQDLGDDLTHDRLPQWFYFV
jgi:phosphatidylglycerophosphate synthase